MLFLFVLPAAVVHIGPAGFKLPLRHTNPTTGFSALVKPVNEIGFDPSLAAFPYKDGKGEVSAFHATK